jgi:hypothetical protein
MCVCVCVYVFLCVCVCLCAIDLKQDVHIAWDPMLEFTEQRCCNTICMNSVSWPSCVFFKSTL